MDFPFAIKEEKEIDYFVISNLESEIKTGTMCNKDPKDNNLSDRIKQEPNECHLSEVAYSEFETYLYDEDSDDEQTKRNPISSESNQNKKRRVKTTQPQYKLLISFMECHPDSNKGKRKTSIESLRFNEDWDRLTNELNAIGPPIRTTTEWRKAWTDFKFNKKRKLAANDSTTLLETLAASPFCVGLEISQSSENRYGKQSRTDQHDTNVSPIYDEDGTNSSKPVTDAENPNLATNEENTYFHSEMLKKVDLVVEQQERQNDQLEKMNKNLETLINILKVKFAND